jgi:hypothetical protein
MDQQLKALIDSKNDKEILAFLRSMKQYTSNDKKFLEYSPLISSLSKCLNTKGSQVAGIIMLAPISGLAGALNDLVIATLEAKDRNSRRSCLHVLQRVANERPVAFTQNEIDKLVSLQDRLTGKDNMQLN